MELILLFISSKICVWLLLLTRVRIPNFNSGQHKAWTLGRRCCLDGRLSDVRSVSSQNLFVLAYSSRIPCRVLGLTWAKNMFDLARRQNLASSRPVRRTLVVCRCSEVRTNTWGQGPGSDSCRNACTRCLDSRNGCHFVNCL